MGTAKVVLMILAVLCFILAAAGVTVPRLKLEALGLFFWATTVLLPLLIKS
jgi:hypothetical protein